MTQEPPGNKEANLQWAEVQEDDALHAEVHCCGSDNTELLKVELDTQLGEHVNDKETDEIETAQKRSQEDDEHGIAKAQITSPLGKCNVEK